MHVVRKDGFWDSYHINGPRPPSPSLTYEGSRTISLGQLAYSNKLTDSNGILSHKNVTIMSIKSILNWHHRPRKVAHFPHISEVTILIMYPSPHYDHAREKGRTPRVSKG